MATSCLFQSLKDKLSGAADTYNSFYDCRAASPLDLVIMLCE